MQDNYNAADAHNLVAIEKGRIYPTDNPQNKCLHARRRRAGSAKTWSYKIQSPSSYAYTQEYTVPGTSLKRTRRGSIGSGRLEDYSAGSAPSLASPFHSFVPSLVPKK